jgi:hypothetical protein
VKILPAEAEAVIRENYTWHAYGAPMMRLIAPAYYRGTPSSTMEIEYALKLGQIAERVGCHVAGWRLNRSPMRAMDEINRIVENGVRSWCAEKAGPVEHLCEGRYPPFFDQGARA